MFHVPLRVPREHAQLVRCPGVLEILDFKGPLAVNQIPLDGRLAAPGFSYHRIEIPDVFSRRHVPRRFPAFLLVVAETNLPLRHSNDRTLLSFLGYVLLDVSILHVGRDVEFVGIIFQFFIRASHQIFRHF